MASSYQENPNDWANCRECGALVNKQYLSHGYCDTCRMKYHEQKFQEERAKRGHLMGRIVHLPNLDYSFHFGRSSQAMCGQFGDLTTLDDLFLGGPICFKCMRALSQELGIDLKAEGGV